MDPQWKLRNRNPVVVFLFFCFGTIHSHNESFDFTFQISSNHVGFHRNICYDVSVLNLNGASCILIKENLPKDIYVDPYQISDKVLIKGSVDSEIPAYLANELEVQLCSLSLTHIHHICIPVHFRYQLPHKCEENGESTLIKMSTPSVFVKKTNDLSNKLFDECFKDMEMKSWMYYKNPKVKCLNFQIPVGCSEHFYPVLILTILTISVSVIYLVLNLLKIENEFKHKLAY